MARSEASYTEVGRFIRQHVIPPGMTVTEAARRLGVGRPALSNLLNGRAALSQDMALRLEGTFGADRARLLELQAASDHDRRGVEDRAVAVGTYAPDFLTIKARQIADWAAGNIEARERLPVLLRRLVHATGRELRHVDFPGYDNAQRHGWDGWIEADAAAPWVPEGRSGWEFGVDQRPSAKGERDYQARLSKIPPSERAECTFVFVTPRNWEGKDRWARSKEAAGGWKAVRALDASDLEQWLETTIAPRIWLAGELGVLQEGFEFETLDRFWNRWVEASDPPLTPAIFAPSIAAHSRDFKKWLDTPRPDRPITVAADSREESIAFVACLLRQEDVPDHHLDRAIVFKSASKLRTLAQSSSPFMPIVYSEEAERELAALYRQRHCIVVRPRNAVDREPDVAVELLGHAAFAEALADIGVSDRERVDALARESGRSPTVLRRRLSPVGAIRTPPWARDQAVARRLMPMALVGAWHSDSPGDREILAALGDRPYEEIERDVTDLLQHDDCPVWRVDRYRGVVSRIDALFAIGPRMTGRDVTDFVDFAEFVLSESDPALELPTDQRWAAGLYGKVREHSSALRNGVCETLVMLSVHGAALFRDLGIDAATLVTALVERLLTPFTSDKLRSHDRDLPGYAEAAPDEFLALLEADLGRPEPAVEVLLKPAGHGPFEHPCRTGLLWALERLAWDPKTFPRVVPILARLSQTEIDDNWVNKPIGSLSALLRSWLPQTAAPLDDRIRVLEALCRRFPDIGWQVCIQQFAGRQQVAFPNNRPDWRDDAAGAGHGVSGRERYEFARKALDIALSWPRHAPATLGDLVEHIDAMPERDRSAVWNVIDDWSRAEPGEKPRADLRERIRRAVLTRHGTLRCLDAHQKQRARAIWEKLGSPDPARRHAWLFASAWVEYSADELDEEELDFDQRAKRIHELRTRAMKEIWTAQGLDGVLALLADGHAFTLGRYTMRVAIVRSAAVDVLRTCLSTDSESHEQMENFICGLLSSVDEDMRPSVVSTVAETATVDRKVRLFRCAPFEDATWRLLDEQDRHVRGAYWRCVWPMPGRFTASETTEIIDRLLEADRPRAAFSAVQFDWDKVETSRLKRLLSAVVQVDSEPAGQFRVEHWDLSEALDSLDGRPGVTTDEMAQLEFAYIEAVHDSKHGIPNLERKMAGSPALFVQALAHVFRRDDGGQDPPVWCVDDPERRVAVGNAAWRLLERAARLPGRDAEGKVDADALRRWITEARRLCREHGRAAIGDQKIGEVLSSAPAEEDGSWPCRPVCDVLEAVGSRDIAAGFQTGVYNARGVVSRGLDEGGDQERALAAKYEAWAQRLAFEYPRVANILERIAKGYDREGEREDADVLARRRLER